MRYIVRASTLNLRTRPTTWGRVARSVPRDTLLTTDLTVAGDIDIIGYDDPATPQPARVSRDWVEIRSLQLPNDAPEAIDPPLFAALAWLELDTSTSGLTFAAEPRITLTRFTRALTTQHSPAAPEAAACYQTCVQFGLDPAIALAFFWHESQFATDPRAIAIRTRNWGNLRNTQGRAYQEAEGFAWYHTWQGGLADWCALIKSRYIARGLDTVETAIPVYAPSSDNNKPAAYIAAVRDLVSTWSQQAT